MEIDETLPEILKQHLRNGAKLESIHLDDRGKWTHEGLDFENRKIIELFNRSVGRSDGGTWLLKIPPFTYPITVSRTGFFVDHVHVEDGRLEARISDQTHETIDLKTLSYEPEGKLFCWIKNGVFEARFRRDAYYALVDYFEEDEDGVFLRIGDERVALIPASG